MAQKVRSSASARTSDPLEDEFLHLARLAMLGKEQDLAMFLRRSSRRLVKQHPGLASALKDVLSEAPTRSSVLRRQSAMPTQIDGDEADHLVRVERPTTRSTDLILSDEVRLELEQVVAERRCPERLEALGLEPAHALLFTGPPGVGKTLGAKWISAQLDLPLMVLDLSAVMSSMLGRTGANIRQAMELAQAQPCVLLLDEIDAVAKRRHDNQDIGELKRLVTVLLQQLDSWPASGGLVVGATNHPELLDPAAWRRFDTVVEFLLPDEKARVEAAALFSNGDLDAKVSQLVGAASLCMSFSDIERLIAGARRRAAFGEGDLEDVVVEMLGQRVRRGSLDERRAVGLNISRQRLATQRAISGLTGLSRDTLRKHTKRG